uniref:hypothetical protein n=1 Tax=Bifidobacterium magnum TaxID=1692 RepID=UPI000529FD10
CHDIRLQNAINVIQLKQLADVLGVYPHEIIEMAEAFARLAFRLAARPMWKRKKARFSTSSSARNVGTAPI